MSENDPQEVIRAVDLFCGAGGLSWGLVEALEAVAIDADQPTDDVLAETIDLVGVNHWERAIETHERNHPWARHFHDDIQHVNPRDVFDDPDPDVTILSGGIECTHWSTARGGKPVDDQKRMPAWDFLTWVQKLRPQNVLVENVPEFCFPADTMVLTENGPVPIQDVEIGTKVLTHKGRWQEVTDTMRRKADTVTVRGRGNALVRCTPDHEFYARSIEADCWGGKSGRHVQSLDEAEWVPAEDLDIESESTYEDVYKGYYWATPQTFGESDLKVPDTPKRVDGTQEAFWRMVGLWLGDGWLHKRNRPDPPHGIRIAGSHPELEAQLDAVNWLTWNRQERDHTAADVFETTCKELAHWLQEHFGEYAHGKTIPAWAFALPEEHRIALVEGYQQADGSSASGDDRVRATTVSKRLAIGLKHLLESIGVGASLPSPREQKDENHRTQYTITWDWTLTHDDNDGTEADGEHRWTRVRETTPDESQVTVYDLTVAEDHSFVADGVVAHNCKWGPIDEDGTPSRNGETFEQWIDSLHALGYSVDWQVLNAADYGDATSRKRLFILAKRDGRPVFPEPTHSEDGHGDTEEWRPAAEIIDWSDPGESIWTRSRPLVESTMQRIAEGIRRHAADRLQPFADAIAQLDKPTVEAMQERVVPAEYAPIVADALDEPFLVAPPEDDSGRGPALASPHLVKYYGTATAKPVGEPVDTITAGGQKYGLCTPYILSQHNTGAPRHIAERPVPTVTAASRGIRFIDPQAFLLGQHGGAMPRGVAEAPVPTVATHGYIRVFDTAAMVLPRNGYQRGLHSNPAYDPGSQPLHTVTAKNHDGHVVRPSLHRFSHGGKLLDQDAPLPTFTTAKGGVYAIAQPQPYFVPYYSERAGQTPRVHEICEPYPTITATGSDPYLANPYLVQYHGQSGARDLDEPTPTVTAKDSLALCVPDLYPWGLDVRFRMLQPRELAAAQGFPDDYEFAGNKTETVEQIGNAVPVNLAQSLVESLLASQLPALTDFVDEEPATADAPSGADVAADGGVPSDD